MFKRLPSKRALAAYVKLHGRRLERRWPFLPRAEGKELNLTFDDLLEFQYARSRDFVFVTVGAFDGLANDPLSRFVRTHDCRGVLLEPQPAVYARLRENFRDFPRCELLNAAVDAVSGSRELYYVAESDGLLANWTEQIASFQLAHVRKHEAQAPGLTAYIRSQQVQTISFGDLIDSFYLRSIDVLQIDAEGMDAQLLEWFPFERMRPSLLHYEIAHMTEEEHRGVRALLDRFGYVARESDSPSDEMAIRTGRH
jgi:FkbM family methyltransferase